MLGFNQCFLLLINVLLANHQIKLIKLRLPRVKLGCAISCSDLLVFIDCFHEELIFKLDGSLLDVLHHVSVER